MNNIKPTTKKELMQLKSFNKARLLYEEDLKKEAKEKILELQKHKNIYDEPLGSPETLLYSKVNRRKQGSNNDKKRYNTPYRGGKIAYKFGNSTSEKYVNRKQKTNVTKHKPVTKRKVTRVKCK